MSRSRVSRSLLVAAITSVTLLGPALVGCTPNPPTPYAPASSDPTAGPEPTGASTAPPNSSPTVDIRNFAFLPPVLTVQAGTTVTWTNSDNPGHVVKFADFSSPELPTGHIYQHLFTTPGTYDYTDRIHPEMKGRVIVR